MHASNRFDRLQVFETKTIAIVKHNSIVLVGIEFSRCRSCLDIDSDELIVTFAKDNVSLPIGEHQISRRKALKIGFNSSHCVCGRIETI